jgi:hypothetical protein
MSEDGKVPLPNLEDRGAQPDMPVTAEPEGPTTRIAADLEAVFDVPSRSRPCSAGRGWKSTISSRSVPARC